MRVIRSTLFRGRHFGDEIIVLCLRWYLRYPLSYRNLEEMMAERGLKVDHSTIARWVLQYAPVLNERIRSEMRRPNRSWRVDETLHSCRGNLNLFISGHRLGREHHRFSALTEWDRTAAKTFLQLALLQAGTPRPHVINVDGHPAYPGAIQELKQSGELSRNCRCRRAPYLNNILEQDHRFVKKRMVGSQGFRSVEGALSTIAGYEAINIIRKGQILWLPKADIIGQSHFIDRTLGVAV
jgi:transposase, IS6 family